jgi:hypothetical protein
MIQRHQSGRRLIATERLAQFSRAQGGLGPRRAKDVYETNSSSNQARHPDWVLIATLTFVIFAWSVLAFCLYVIVAKCRDSSAALLGVSLSPVKNHWFFSKAWVFREIERS